MKCEQCGEPATRWVGLSHGAKTLQKLCEKCSIIQKCISRNNKAKRYRQKRINRKGK